MSYVNDTRLSYKARGILAYAAHKPNAWRLQVYDLINVSEKDGRKSVQSGIRELIKYGYLSYIRVPYNDEGRHQGSYYQLNVKMVTGRYLPSRERMSYRLQYQTREWSEKREGIINRDNYKCVKCGNSNVILHVHHKKYIKGRKVWEYPDDALETLCERCHEKYHKEHQGSSLVIE